MWGILVALLSGALMSLQGIFNTEVTKQSSIWAAAGWVQLTAFLTCVVLYFFTGRGEIWGMFSIDRKYMLLGGVMGAFITWTVIKSMDGLGPAKATLLIVVTQILVSYIAEVFGLFGVEKAALSGGSLLVRRWRLRGSLCFGGSAAQGVLKMGEGICGGSRFYEIYALVRGEVSNCG